MACYTLTRRNCYTRSFLGQDTDESYFYATYDPRIEHAKKFSDALIKPDMDWVNAEDGLIRMKKLIDIAKSSDNYGDTQALMIDFIGKLKGPRNSLQAALEKTLTDAETQKVVNEIALFNETINAIRTAFPDGIKAYDAATAQKLSDEVDSLVGQLQQKRNEDYRKAMEGKYQALQEQKARNMTTPDVPVPSEPITSEPVPSVPDTGAPVPGNGPASSPVTTGAPVDTVPGGGAPDVDTGAPVPVEPTAMQKYGPIAALAAGGLAAYLALR